MIAGGGLSGRPERIATLDLLRGVAVLGILAVNVAGFAGPRVATDTPNLPQAVGPWDEAAFGFVFLVFEGKMRALFSMLFGASMLLFIEQAERRGRDGDLLQVRRLGWLLLIGWLHSMLLWWGDILFVYAVAGAIALALRRLPSAALLAIAGEVFAGWHGWGMLGGWWAIGAEEHARLGVASAGELAWLADARADTMARMTGEIAQARLGFFAMIADKLGHEPGWPVVMTIYTLGETVPLMLLGMVLLRSGFLAGRWPRGRMRAVALAGTGLGGAMTVAFLGYLAPRHYPVETMRAVLGYGAAPAHLLMALGYAAGLVMAAPWLLKTGLGVRLAAAGRMAFTNYLATTVAMCGLFYGWGLGLYGRVPPAGQLGVMLAWWAVMLGWSAPWLARFRQGPLEWAWRSLTEWRAMPMRKS